LYLVKIKEGVSVIMVISSFSDEAAKTADKCLFADTELSAYLWFVL
jgi:hypothetical protein